jgi:hypothetical protein
MFDTGLRTGLHRRDKVIRQGTGTENRLKSIAQGSVHKLNLFHNRSLFSRKG